MLLLVCRVPFTDEKNQRVAKKILTEVKMNNKMFTSSHIRGICYNFPRIANDIYIATFNSNSCNLYILSYKVSGTLTETERCVWKKSQI